MTLFQIFLKFSPDSLLQLNPLTHLVDRGYPNLLSYTLKYKYISLADLRII
jgi:hypothetical protein